MDLRQIMYFMSAYEERSITKAARKVGLVQPALSVQIKRLEDEFGGALFVRQRGGIDPTALGISFYKLCQPIRASIAQAQQSMRDLREPGQVFGGVRCGFPPSYFKAVLGAVLSDFAERYPGVDLTVREGYGGTLRRWVADGELDFAFGSSSQAASGLADITVFEEDLALVSGRPLAGKSFTPCDIGSIADLKLMLPSPQQNLARSCASTSRPASSIPSGPWWSTATWVCWRSRVSPIGRRSFRSPACWTKCPIRIFSSIRSRARS
jgi:LysR family transcriptional regulator, nitrogen assimilation regulatory protein